MSDNETSKRIQRDQRDNNAVIEKATAVIRPYLLAERDYGAGDAAQARSDAESAARELANAGLLVDNWTATALADAVEMIKQCIGHPDQQEPRTPSHFALIKQARQERDAARAELDRIAHAVDEFADHEARTGRAFLLQRDAARADVRQLRAKVVELRTEIERLRAEITQWKEHFGETALVERIAKTAAMDAALVRFGAAHDEVDGGEDTTAAEPVCRCGHTESAHDAGECWTATENHAHPATHCPCSWYEPVQKAGAE